MKKIMIILISLTVLLSACSTSTNEASGNLPEVSDELSVEAELVVGTLQLDESGQSVTSEQANELLVMWQAYQELSESDTTAQAEIDGLVEQIQGTMTETQLDAIEAMDLNQQDVFAMMQAHAASSDMAMEISRTSSDSGSMEMGGMEGGGPPDGGMGGGALMDSGMADMSDADMMAGADQDAGAGREMANTAAVSSALVEYLIETLQQIASS